MSVCRRAAAGLALAAAFSAVADAGRADTALSGGSKAQWAYVLRPVAARTAPTWSAGAAAVVAPTTPEGATNLVLALAERDGRGGDSWVRIRLATLPNGVTAWVPREALGDFHLVQTRLVVDRARLTISLYRQGRLVFRAPVGVGQPQWPTPRGQFYVRERLDGFGDPFYGPIAFGTSGRSTQLTDWPGGGYVGIHGTESPQLIPGRISHGCIRLRNDDIVRLSRVLPLGTPLTIR
jgi:lipoprotein-anchoring transpeptidase ErfK/SrfK